MSNETEIDVIFKLDIRNVKKALALMDEDIPSNEQIREEYKDCVVVMSKYNDEDIQSAVMAFTLMVIQSVAERKEKSHN